MKFLSIVPFIALAQFASAQDKVTFTSGDSLQGDILGTSGDRTISLLHTASENPLLLDAKQIARIDLNNKEKGANQKTESIIELANGDIISGSIQSIDSEFISFTSPLSGQHKLKRSQVNFIAFGNSINYPIYQYASSPKLFTKSSGWVINQNQFESQKFAQMWQKFPLTKNFILKCDIAWSANPQITFHLGANSSSPASDNARYALRMQSSTTALWMIQANRRSQEQKVTCKLRDFTDNKAAVEIWVSQTTGNVTLYLNGKKIHTFPAPLTPGGDFIGIQNWNSNGQLSVKNLEISTWDGNRPPDNLGFTGSSKQDVVSLINGSQLTGKVLNSREIDGKPHFDIEYGHAVSGSSEPFKQSDIRVIKFASEKRDEVSNNLPSGLKGGCMLKLSNIRINDGKVLADHEILGALSIDKKHFSFLQLNLSS
jgi:hypothetical protein